MNIVIPIAPEATCALADVSDWFKNLLNELQDNNYNYLSPMEIKVMQSVIKALDTAADEAQTNG